MATRFDKGTWRKWSRRYYYFKEVMPPKEWSNGRLKNEVQALELRKRKEYWQGKYWWEHSKLFKFLARLWYGAQGLFLKTYALTYMWYLKYIKRYGKK